MTSYAKHRFHVLDGMRGVAPYFQILLGATFFLAPAALNGFPFIFPDSGDYLVLHPLLHRSPYYGLLITFLHLNRFIWSPVAMQCLAVSHLVWLLMRLVTGKTLQKYFLLVIGFLTAFSSVPFFTGFIMADIFTPIMFLTMYIIGFHYRSLSRPLLAYLVFLDCVATASHISNLTLGIGLLALFTLLISITVARSWERFKPLAILTAPIAATAAAILLFNVVVFSSWSISPAGQSFLMANLIQYGPARHYLQDACPVAGYKICAYVDQLPETADELLWTTGIYQKLGGFPGMQDEAKHIVRQTIETRPFEVLKMVARNFVAGLFTHKPAAEFRREYQVPSFPDLIALKFGERTLTAYQNSAEMRNAIPYGLLSANDGVVFPISFVSLVAIAFYVRRRRTSEAFTLSVTIVCFIIGDTLLCTALSGVHDRYQARVTWLAPLGVVLLLFRLARKVSETELQRSAASCVDAEVA